VFLLEGVFLKLYNNVFLMLTIIRTKLLNYQHI